MFGMAVPLPIMSRNPVYATDFSDYATGVSLTSDGRWTGRKASGNDIECTVNASGGSVGGRRVTIGSSSVGVRAATLAAFAGGDADILALIQWGSAGSNGGSGLIARASATATDAYNAVQHGTASPTNGVFEIAEIVGGSYSSLGGQTAVTPISGGRYWVRLRCFGTLVKGRIWQFGSSEDTATEKGTTDSTNPTGFAGLMVVDSSPDYFCEWFSIAPNGKVAPGPQG